MTHVYGVDEAGPEDDARDATVVGSRIGHARLPPEAATIRQGHLRAVRSRMAQSAPGEPGAAG